MTSAPHAAAAPPLSPALRSFEAQWLARDSTQSDPLTVLRQSAMQRVMRLGLPTTRDETWRYTNLRHLTSHGFIDAPATAPALLQPSASLSLVGVDELAATVLMVNGHPVLPDGIDAFFNGIEITSLRDLSRTDPALVAGYLEPLSDADQSRWALINTALFVDGLYLKVTGKVKTPLVILHVSTAEAANHIAHPRVIIDAVPGSSATIIEHYVEQGTHRPLCNSATHIAAGRDSKLEHYRVFATSAGAEHIDSLTLRLGGNSLCKQRPGAHLARSRSEPARSLSGCLFALGGTRSAPCGLREHRDS
jgi:Fe-S cluster assembly protein SufD